MEMTGATHLGVSHIDHFTRIERTLHLCTGWPTKAAKGA